MDLEEFRIDLINEIKATAQIDSDYPQDVFTDYCKDILINDFGLLSDLNQTFADYKTPNTKYRYMHIDASSLEPSVNTIHLLYSDFSDEEVQPINNEFVNSKRTLMENFVVNVLSGFYTNASDSDPATELARAFLGHVDDINKIHVIIVSTNKKSERLKTTFACKPLVVKNRTFSVDLTLLDIDGIYQTKLAGFKKDDIEIETKDYDLPGIPCIKADIKSDDYDSYLAVVPGKFLSDIYLKYGSRLLESNVRSFLNTKGQINKGILNTILNEKSRFFAYNNGISTTADSIETSIIDGSEHITGFKNLQIINGGQTTASLASAVLKNSADLSDIFVQMKLSIIKKEDQRASLVREISKFANKQNKVTNADLSSNDPFYIRIEDFSRKIKTPLATNSTVQSIWFFERARGSYDQARMKLKTKHERDVFELQNPKAQRFTKTDLAKYINAAEMKPFDVSWGADVNMTRFQGRLEKAWEANDSVFNDAYYRDLIAKAIMFKHIEWLISNEEWYIECKGYRNALVPYTFSKFIYEISKTKKEFNYKKVWEGQAVPECYDSDLKKIAKICFDVFYDTNRPVANIAEYAKREVCWDNIKDITFQLSPDTTNNLISKEEKEIEKRASKKDQKVNNELNSEIAIFTLGVGYWNKVLERGKQLGELNDYEILLIDAAVKYCKQIYRSLSKTQISGLAAIKKKMDQYLNQN